MDKTKIIVFCMVLVLILIHFLYQYYNNSYKFKRESYYSEKYIEDNQKYLKSNINISNETKLYIHQTYFDKTKIPQDVYENIKKYAPEYEHVVYDDNDIIAFLQEYFSEAVLNTFHLLKEGAHKADLARYCMLYIHGGAYLDIKTELVMPMSDILKEKETFYSVISYMGDHLYQGIIVCPKQNPIFLSLIDYIVKVGNPYNYFDFCKDLYYQVGRDVKSTIVPGINKGLYQNYYLFQEKCSNDNKDMCYDGFDRYGFCCFVWDGDKPIIK